MNKTSEDLHPVLKVMDELIRTSSRLREVVAQPIRDSGLKKTELTVLTAVVEAERAPTVPQIGRSLGTPRQVIQRAANSLIEAGMIEAKDNPDHKRASLLLPTQQGAALKKHIDSQAVAAADDLLQLLDRSECEQLASDIRKLRRSVESFVRQGHSDGAKT